MKIRKTTEKNCWLVYEMIRSTDCSWYGMLYDNVKEIFVTFNLFERLVSDDGPSFNDYQFREFLRVNGIKHSLISPYHPPSNGQA